MKLHSVGRFLTAASANLPATGGPFVACAIHPSSEVDLAMVGGQRLSVGSIVPIEGNAEIVAIRGTPTSLLDGADNAGQLLVLQLYEACDALIPPGVRAPVTRSAALEGVIGATITTATPALRLPFQGRREAVIRFNCGGGTGELNVVVIGAKYGTRELEFEMFTQADTETLSGGAPGGAGGPHPEVTAGLLEGLPASVTVHYGGGGDTQEDFDELLVFVYGGVGLLTPVVFGEAFGERVI